MILKVQYLKLRINAYWVIATFEVSEIYLIDPAKEIFRKFPKMDILKNVLILRLDIYLIEFTQLTKTSVLGLVYVRILHTYIQIWDFLGIAHEGMISQDEFESKKNLKIENW